MLDSESSALPTWRYPYESFRQRELYLKGGSLSTIIFKQKHGRLSNSRKISPLTTFYYSGIAFSKGLRAKTIVLLLISQQEKSKLASSLQDSLKQWMFSRCVSMQKIVS